MEGNHQTLAKNYVFTAIQIHAQINEQISSTQNLQKNIHITSEATSLLIKKKQKLMNIRDHIDSKMPSFNTDPHLVEVLEKPNQFVGTQLATTCKLFPKIFPKITVPDMGWVLRYFQEINMQMFKEISEAQQQQKIVVQGLQTNLQRYEDRLKRLEQNLEKKFNDAKNRRF